MQALQLGKERAERMAAMELVGSVRRDAGNRGVAHAPHQEAEEVSRGSIGPVEILDDEQDGGVLGQASDQAEDNHAVIGTAQSRGGRGESPMIERAT